MERLTPDQPGLNSGKNGAAKLTMIIERWEKQKELGALFALFAGFQVTLSGIAVIIRNG